MDNVDNPKTFWRACAFGLLGLWKSLGCAGDILGKTAFWRACARILAGEGVTTGVSCESILARLRADFGGAAAGLDGSLREAVRSLAPKRAILAAPKAVIHIIPKSAFPQK